MSRRSARKAQKVQTGQGGAFHATLAAVCVNRPRIACSCCALLMMFGLGCEDPTIGAGHPRLEVSPGAVDFGSVFVGIRAEATFQLKSTGDVGVGYSLRFVDSPSVFDASPRSGFLGAGAEEPLRVSFRPTEPGLFGARLVIEVNDVDSSTRSLAIVGRGLDIPACEDGNVCTEDEFDILTGRCVRTAATFACDDANACTTRDVCLNALCVGEAVACEDNNACTDDLCDPRVGCVHVPTRSCDDHNPCTFDVCTPEGDCVHEDVKNGTLCDDFEPCTKADICLFGRCRGVTIPDGSECDDGDPCSKHDVCQQGRCLDPTYVRPGPGDLKFMTHVGSVSAGAPLNPIVDGEGTIYVGTDTGVIALDSCGDVLWRNDRMGTPHFAAAILLPGRLMVPTTDRIFTLETTNGSTLSARRIDAAFPALSPRFPATATVSHAIFDVAVRASGALVVAAERTITSTNGTQFEERLVELDASHEHWLLFADLGRNRARRVAIDRDESVVAILEARDRSASVLFRAGIDGVAGTTWTLGRPGPSLSDLALGPRGEILFDGRVVTTTQATYRLWDRIPTSTTAGPFLHAPVFFTRTDAAWLVAPNVATTSVGMQKIELVAFGHIPSATIAGDRRVRFVVPHFQIPERLVTPAADADQNVFVLAVHPRIELMAVDPYGRVESVTPLLVSPDEIRPSALTISPKNVILLVTQHHVVGVQWTRDLGTTSWPRHRRDNYSTGHR